MSKIIQNLPFPDLFYLRKIPSRFIHVITDLPEFLSLLFVHFGGMGGLFVSLWIFFISNNIAKHKLGDRIKKCIKNSVYESI